MYKLYIEDPNGIWQLADLGDDKPAMNYQTNNIAELKDRQANYSQALKLPPTPRNCALFGYSDSFDVVTTFPYNKHNCRLFSNEYLISGPGSYIVLDKVNKFFEVAILSGNANFFETLNKPMSLLDLGYVVYGADGVTNQSFTTGDYYMYCLCTTVKGGYHYISPLESEAFPFVFLLDAFKQMIEQNGFTADVEPIAPLYATTICSLKPHDQYMTEFNATGLVNSSANLKLIVPNGAYCFPVTIVAAGHSLESFGTSSPDRGCQYHARETGSIKLDIALEVTAGQNVGNVGVSVKNVTQDTVSFLYAQPVAPFAYTGNVTMPVNKGDVIQVLCYAYNINDNPGDIIGYDENNEPIYSVYPDAYWDVDMDCDIVFSNIEYAKVPIGGKLYLADNIGFETQLDFMKSVAQLFGFTMVVNNDTKVVSAYTMQKLYDNKSIAKDWSAKLHQSDGDTEFVIAGYARNNFIRFEDNTADNVQDKGNFEVANETLDVWKDLFTVKFEAGLDNLASGEMVANIPITEKVIDETTGDFWFDFIGGKPHVVILTNDVPIRQPPLPDKWIATHAKAQSFIDVYYLKLIEMLSGAKWKEDEFYLADQDIAEFDQFTPVYIRKYGRSFYVNKIKNFVSGKLTKCEIVRL